jgi:hypothetical protein
MTIRNYFRFLCHSALGLGALFLALTAGVLLIAGGYGPAIAALGFGGAVVVLVAAGFVTGLGPKAAAREGERLAALSAARKLEEGRDRLLHLSALRLADGEVAKARDLVVLEGRRFLESCPADGKGGGGREGGPSYDPAALAAMGEALELVDAWLRESDESAIEKRFGSKDSHPIEDGEARVAVALREKAALIVKARDLVSSEIPGSDRIAIEEELK